MSTELIQMQRMFNAGVEMGMKRLAAELGLIKPYVSMSEAYKLYGRGTVDRWVGEKLIEIIKDGDKSSKIRISRMDLEILAKASNRTSYLPTNER